MNDPFLAKGTLSVSIGEGYLSAFEIGALKPSDVVRTSRMAGASYPVLYNGMPLAQCEAVILSAAGGGNIFGIRISDTDFPSTFGFGPVRQDEVGELLPLVVSLGSIEISLAELRGVGVNSIVSLGKPWSLEEDATLVVAGSSVAAGKVVCIGEEMGLRITRLLAKPAPPATVASSGYLLDRETASTVRVKDYDFRRPDKFSLQQILRFRDTHTLFLQNLRARLPALGSAMQSESYPARVDQCTLGEAVEELGKQGLADRLVIENQPWRRVPRESFRRWPQPERFRVLVEEENAAHPVDARVRSFAEEYLKEHGLANRNPIFLYYARNAETRRVVAEEQEALLACLRGAWRSIVELNLAAILPDEVAGMGTISLNEMVILATFTSREDRTTLLGLVYPYLTLEPFVRLLGR